MPLPKVLASPRNTQIPAPGQQDGAPEAPNPGDTEACRLRFRQFQYRVAGGPHNALGHLWMLLRQWLRPETHSKEQIMELLVLEQFLGALPSKMRTWVQSQDPRTCKEAATLVEDLTEMSQQEGEGTGLTPKSKWLPGGAGVVFGFWPMSPWPSAQGSRFFFLWDSECRIHPALLPHPPTRSHPAPSPHQQRPRPSEQTPACTCPARMHCRITHLCFSLFYINVIVLHTSVRLTSLTQSVVEDSSILPCVHLACGFALVCSPSEGPRVLAHTRCCGPCPPHQVLSSPPLHPVHATQTCPGGPRVGCGDCRLGPWLSQNGCRRERGRGVSRSWKVCR